MSDYLQSYNTLYLGEEKIVSLSYEQATDVNGLHTLSEWIKYRPGEEIPNELCTFSLFLNSALHTNIFTLWKESRPNEPLPIQFFNHHQED